MLQKVAPSENDVLSFIYCVKTGSVEEIKKQIDTYTPEVVSRLQLQSRQPALHFSALILDHEKAYLVMKMLIEAGANPFYKDYYHQTVLFYVCRQGNQKCFDMLVELGIPIDDVDTFGQTPIYYVARENRLSLFHKLVNKVDINRIDGIAHQTPLFYAAKEGHLEMCRLLVDAGCDIFIQDALHKTAAHYAKVNSRADVHEYLISQMYKNKEQRRINAAVKNETKLENPQEPLNGSNEKTQPIIKEKPTKKKEKEAPLPKSQYKLVKTDSVGNSSEVSVQELRQLYKMYPDLQKILGNPDAIEQAQLDSIKSKEKESWQKLALKTLTACWKTKGSFFFQEPVDPVKFNIPDYFVKITNPMDFTTIKKKLSHNCYKSPDAFVSDMQLVFSNCLLYNGPDNPVSQHAIEIRQLFENNCKTYGLPLS